MSALRFIYILIYLVVATLVCGLLISLIGLVDRSKRVVWFIVRLWAKGLLAVSGVKVKSRGLEHLERAYPCLLVSNHKSHMDAPSLISQIKRPFRFVAKRSLAYIPVFGQALYGLGSIIIDRSKQDKAFRSIDKAAQRVKEGT